MDKAKLVGVGCIGRPDRVARLLGKIMNSTRSSFVIPSEAESENERLSASESAAGFYIGCDHRGLNLSFYAQNRDGSSARVSRGDAYRLEFDKQGLH